MDNCPLGKKLEERECLPQHEQSRQTVMTLKEGNLSNLYRVREPQDVSRTNVTHDF